MRRPAAIGRLCLVFLVPLAGCSLLTDFDPRAAVEQQALCADGADNDADGLIDCQDWKCLGEPSCCTLPSVVVVDDFGEPACALDPCAGNDGTCPAIDEEIWQPWGSPLPIVCEGRLSPNKVEQCFDVGVLGRAAFPLKPGLTARATAVGIPESRGRLELGLTFQEEILGNTDHCAAIEPVSAALGIRMVAVEGGYVFVGRFGDRDVGWSPVYSDGGAHQIGIRVEDDRRTAYLVDGTPFATSRPTEVVPSPDAEVRVVLAGRGETAGFADVHVTVGNRCDAPGAWTAADPFERFGPADDLATWDNFSVYSPSVVPEGPGLLHLFYGGCREGGGHCDEEIAGITTASSIEGSVFVRDNLCAIFSSPGLLCPGGLTPFQDFRNVYYDLDAEKTGSGWRGFVSRLSSGREIAVVASADGMRWELSQGPYALEVGRDKDDWDRQQICCATAEERDGRTSLWYAGQAEPEGPWRIGLAESDDGVTFVKHVGNPVLEEGASGFFDDGGVSHPLVLWDAARRIYRMWYRARDAFGLTSIGYAVSPDGITWHRFPDNPVVPSELGDVTDVDASVVVEEGGLRMWIQGRPVGLLGGHIYELVNTGSPP